MNTNEITIIDPKTILFFYKLTCDEINAVKKKQWNTVYYTLLINILSVVFIKLVPEIIITNLLKYIIASIIGLATLISMIYLINFQNELVKYDFRLRRIQKHLPKDKYLILDKMPLTFSSTTFYFFGVILPFGSILFLTLAASVSLILL